MGKMSWWRDLQMGNRMKSLGTTVLCLLACVKTEPIFHFQHFSHTLFTDARRQTIKFFSLHGANRARRKGVSSRISFQESVYSGDFPCRNRNWFDKLWLVFGFDSRLRKCPEKPKTFLTNVQNVPCLYLSYRIK